MWNDLFLNHFYQPQYVGELSQGLNTHRAKAEIAGGDKVQLDISWNNGLVEDARFQAYGCPATIACMSWLTSALIGKSREAAKKISAQEISQSLALPAHKFRSALLAEEVLYKILEVKNGYNFNS